MATTRTRKTAKKTAAPAPEAPRLDKTALAIEDQAHAAFETRRTGTEQVMEHRTVGTGPVFCAIGKRADGGEVLLLAMVFNPHGEMVAIVGPTDADGILWRHRTMREHSVEVTRHASLLDAVEGARLEAAERGAWDATNYDAVTATYAANPRKPPCEACGR